MYDKETFQNSEHKEVIYLTYDGLTDSLGQSQVIPYLNKLCESGYKIYIISCEKKERMGSIHSIRNVLHSNIHWQFTSYTKRPAVLSTLFDIFKIRRIAKKTLETHTNIYLVHCRSYITSLAGLWLKRKYGIKFIFDMRGFYADERVDGKIWNLNNFLFKMIFNYFKKKEKQFLNESDYTVSLTESGKEEILKWDVKKDIRIEVIPCCTDQNLFSAHNISDTNKKDLQLKLKIQDSDFIISYLGGMGTWYIPAEMFSFFNAISVLKPQAKFLIITNDDAEEVRKKAIASNTELSKIIITSAKRDEVPTLLSLSAVNMFFIKPVYSKKASCPTKLGEALCMGIPVICNSGVGDVDRIINSMGSGILVEKFTEASYKKTLAHLDDLVNLSAEEIRTQALPYFSLESGVQKYKAIYDILLTESKR